MLCLLSITQPIRADWSREFGLPISAVTLLETQPAEVLVLQMSDRTLRVINAPDGDALSLPATLPPGLAPLGAVERHVALVGRDSLHVLVLEDAAPDPESPLHRSPSRAAGAPASAPACRLRFAWSASATGLATATDDDPEFERYFVCATVAAHGILLLRNDGEVSLLSVSDGAVLQRFRVPPPGEARAASGGGCAVLFSRAAGAASAWFVCAPRNDPRPASRPTVAHAASPLTIVEVPLGSTLPIWSQFVGRDLVCVWPARGLLVGEARRVEFEPPAALRSFSAALLRAEPEGSGVRLWCAAETGGAAWLDIPEGRSAAVETPSGVRGLRRGDGVTIAFGEDWYQEVQPGRGPAPRRAPGDSRITDVRCERRSITTVSSARVGERSTRVSIRVQRPGAERADEVQGVQEVNLADGLRQVLWTRDGVLLVSERTLVFRNVFGSRIDGSADRWSDIDVAAFIEDGGRWDLERRVKVRVEARREAGDDVELHLFPAAALDKPPRASFAQRF